MSDDELDLGIAPPKKRVPMQPEQNPKTVRTWEKYSASDRRFCDLCLAHTPQVEGVYVRAVPRAVYIERDPLEPGTVLYLCYQHKPHRTEAFRGE